MKDKKKKHPVIILDETDFLDRGGHKRKLIEEKRKKEDKPRDKKE